MKKFFIFLIFSPFFSEVYSQWGGGFINFDDSSDLFRISIDTSISNNIWQIGKPDKQFFKEAYSVPNDIITDSINPYPINNTSIFYLGINLTYPNPGFYEETDFSFFYKMDSDTLNDYGKIEFSIDTGQTYYNLLQTAYFQVTDSVGNIIANYGNGNSIVFTGKSIGWYHFYSTLIELPSPDTIIFRFTFHSDANQNNRDGWMIDNVGWFTWYEGINEKNFNFTIFPNPTKDVLQFDSKIKIKEISIISELGRTILTKAINVMPISIEVKDLQDGIYLVKIINDDNTLMMKKFIKLN